MKTIAKSLTDHFLLCIALCIMYDHVMYVGNVLYLYIIIIIILFFIVIVICDPPCAHGACVANNTCNCAEGYSGARCTEPGMCIIMCNQSLQYL